MARKTYTSPDVKNRWNKRHYDRIGVMVPIGSKKEIQTLAEISGMSVSEYIRKAIKEKAEREGKADTLKILRGGERVPETKFLRYDKLRCIIKNGK